MSVKIVARAKMIIVWVLAHVFVRMVKYLKSIANDSKRVWYEIINAGVSQIFITEK